MGRGGDSSGTKLRQRRPSVGRSIIDDASGKDLQVVTMEEVSKHCTPEDCWLVFGGNVYDVSNWVDHPGGRIIFTHAGMDCTDTFNAFHPVSAKATMDPFLVGQLAEEDVKMTPAERDYRAMRARVKRDGLTEASTAYYIFKCATNLSIIGAAVYLVLAHGGWLANMAAALLIALFWQQCGWLSHDYLHHQVFENRAMGDLFGVIIGNVSQGFSVEWWKDKHNTHHAIPNLLPSGKEMHDGDPDIDTMPFLAWSFDMARAAMNMDSAVGRFFMRHQATLYFPILLIARVSWMMQSFTFVFRLKSPWSAPDATLKPLHLGFVEHAGLLVHYAWYFGLMTTMSWQQALAFFALSQTACGLLLAVAFGVGHNGMAVYENDKKPDFLTLQVTTTRNVDGNWLVGWFMGGLHHQIEHHLFPYVPRHNLHKVRKLVEPLCVKHNIPYYSTSMWQGTLEVLDHLGAVSEELVHEFPGL